MIYELRTYYAAPGQTERIHRRFADHTLALFAKHGLHVVGFWTPDKEPNTLVYLLRFPSPEAMKQSWASFAADPEWKKAKAESEVEGRLVADFKSEVMTLTPYSPTV
ncbi:MAG: NIPSNAP family protein [Gammaproteobacteria bacterium]|nr:NIPSNAP family protein [Gammaproteobacteria bacterium]